MPLHPTRLFLRGKNSRVVADHSASPPRPAAVFRVGITGHRPNRLEADTAVLRSHLHEALVTIREEVWSAQPASMPVPKLRLISSLAEGVDRIAAHCALELGYSLQVPLPLPRAEFEKDFSGSASCTEFQDLLRQADAVFELESTPPLRDLAYRAAGHMVLQQCDLLLAVWDGEPSRGAGGTPELIDVAEEMRRPMLYMQATAPYTATFSDAADGITGVRRYIRTWFGAAKRPMQACENTYLCERWPRHIPTTSYTLLRLLGEHRWLRARAPELVKAGFELKSPVLQSYFGWMDALAIYYGERSRSVAMRMQLLASAAVVAAILILPCEGSRRLVQVLSFTEISCIVWLLLEAMRSSRSDWHSRWLLYRSLAEKLRCLDFLAPLGETITSEHLSGAPDQQIPNVHEFGINFIQGVVRELGMHGASADAVFRQQQEASLVKVVRSQATFQHRVAMRYESVEKLLHRVGMALFAIAIALCLLDVARALGPRMSEVLDGVGLSGLRLASAAAILPALGAALAGLAAQGEYKRLAMRSDAMGRTLLTLLREFEKRPSHNLRALQAFANQVAEVLMSEVQDWQVLVSAKPPSLPT